MKNDQSNWSQKPDTLFIYQKLLHAYGLCVRGKPSLKSTDWHWRAEKELSALAFALSSRLYQPGLSSIFIVKNPKPREVIAANIRDRVVHRMVYEYMSPYWEKRFLPFSFACRRGKGPLAAVREVEQVIRRQNRAHSRPLYALKVDVSRFFPSLQHFVLLKILKKHLENDFFLWLTAVLVNHRPTEKGKFRLCSPKEDWKLIEPEKSLFMVSRNLGLPIGNLTSQFFANVYMHQFDVFLSNQKKGNFLYAQRYVDDVLILGFDKGCLNALVQTMQGFLAKNLGLNLNPKKTSLQPVSNGLDHLGFFIKPTHTTVRRSVKKRAEKMATFSEQVSDEKVLQQLVSAFGHSAHGRNVNWRHFLAKKVQSARPGLCFAVCPKARKIRKRNALKRYLSLEESIGVRHPFSGDGENS